MPAMSAIEAAFCRSAPWRAFAARVVLPWVLDGRSLAGDVLELGSGSGAMAAAMVARDAGVRLMATDVDPKMLGRLEARLAPYAGRASVRSADVTSLPFAAASFDAVASFLMLHHVIEWRAALAEAGRVLRPGGALWGYDLLDTAVARFVHRVDGSPHELIVLEDMHDGLLAAGFVEVAARPALGGLVVRFSARWPGAHS